MRLRRAVKNILDEVAPTAMRYFRQFRAERNAQIMRTSQHGFVMTGPSLYLTLNFEREELAFFKRALGEIELFVDVGANVGVYSLIAARAKKQVIAVEPLENNLMGLLRNLEANGFTDVEVFPIGAADAPGVLKIYNTGSMGSFVKGWGKSSENFYKTVPTNTLDRIVGNRAANKRSLIKIDVEGFELSVLSGAKGLLLNDPKPIWLVENFLVSKSHPDLINPNFLSVLEVFWNSDYAVYLVGDDTPVKREEAESWVRERKDLGSANFIMKSVAAA